MDSEVIAVLDEILADLRDQFEKAKNNLVMMQDLSIEQMNIIRGGAYTTKMIIDKIEKYKKNLQISFMEDDND